MRVPFLARSPIIPVTCFTKLARVCALSAKACFVGSWYGSFFVNDDTDLNASGLAFVSVRIPDAMASSLFRLPGVP